MDVNSLSRAHCILLAVHLASESNITALHSFTPKRHDVLDTELVLRILLTYLPEALDPREYANYVEELATHLYLNLDREDVEVSAGPIKDISEEEAKKQVRKLKLVNIKPANWPKHGPSDVLSQFLVHRAQRIDQETGLIELLPKLLEPHLSRNPFLRTWYISVVLPLLRMEVEYYPGDETVAMPLVEFEAMDGKKGVELLLSRSSRNQTPEEKTAARENVSRDIKSLLGPWMYGHTERKRRKLDPGPYLSEAQDETDRDKQEEREGNDGKDLSQTTQRLRKISLAGINSDAKTGHDWEHVFNWMVQQAADDLGLVAGAIDGWDGPGDVDLGGFDQTVQYLDEEVQVKLELQYAQASFASCYVAQADAEETIQNAHAILARLAELLDFVPPPDLATSVDALPKIARHAIKLEGSRTAADLLPDALFRPEHPLTTPRLETYMLLQMMVYSAYQFSGLHHPLSLISVTKLHFYATADEQLDTLRKILRGLSKSGSRKDESQWVADRAKLLWLWHWGIEADPEETSHEGSGVLGKIPRDAFETEMLKLFTETSCYKLAIELYLSDESTAPLSKAQVESVVLSKAMEAYDGASNGNKQRGAMKKANDIINAFKPYFAGSVNFEQRVALIAATHSLSFYSLTLQHGVPFQPVTIRVSHNPLSLISKVLGQNSRSYTKLDDLIDIARNLVSAGLTHDEEDVRTEGTSAEHILRKRRDAERRVIYMAIEASLREDDFETAYSYIVNRLTPSGADIQAPSQKGSINKHNRQESSQPKNAIDDDDISWRAAFLAGRYRPAASSPPSLRRLEQRTELLSLALLLAPTSALTEILAAWRRCEEEMTSLQLAEQQAAMEFDDRADKRLSGSSALPGNFTVEGEQPELILGQKRREMGRVGMGPSSGVGGKGKGTRGGNDETPLSMFDLTRNAAKAFSKNAFAPGGEGSGLNESHAGNSSLASSMASVEDAQARTRKRDLVANVVSGGLASGLGWVLGATPQQAQEQERQG